MGEDKVITHSLALHGKMDGVWIEGAIENVVRT